MDVYAVDYPKGLIPYSLEIMPTALRQLEAIPELEMTLITREIPGIALQPAVVEPTEGFPGKLGRLEVVDNKKIIFVVLYMVDSTRRTVKVLDISSPQRRYKIMFDNIHAIDKIMLF